MLKPVIAYEYSTGLYLNITNRCPTSCVFCIKRKWEMDYRGNDLNLRGKEPSFSEILGEISSKFNSVKHKELVFCGYGEPTMRFDIIKEISGAIREGKLENVPENLRIRINTNGLGSLVNGRDITPEMKGLIDCLNVSMNCADPEGWAELMRPEKTYLDKGFESVKDFIRKASKNVPEVVMTAVEGRGCDVKALEKLAKELGVPLRLRPELENEN